MTTPVAATETPDFNSILSGIQAKARKEELTKLAHVFVELTRHNSEVVSVLAEIKRIGESENPTAEEVRLIDAKARRLYQGR